MTYLSRQDCLERMEIRLQVSLGRRFNKAEEIAQRTKSERVRKKARGFVDGVKRLANLAIAEGDQLRVDMTDQEVRDMVWSSQQKALRLMRKNRLRLKGVTGGMGMGRFTGPDRVIAHLNELRNELKALP